MSARRIEPTRSLTDQRKPHRYVPASNTDVRATFEKHRRLQAAQARARDSSNT